MNRRLFLAGTAGLAAGGLLAEAPYRSLGPAVVEAASPGPWPDQAVLFDGSTGPADTYYDALSQVGILTDLLGFLYSCGSTSHQMSGGVIKLAAGPAVYQSLLNVGPYITPTAPPPSILPPPLLVAKNDCDLLLAIGAVEQYVQSVTSQTQVLLSQITACRDRVRVLWCEVCTAVEQAPILPPLPPPILEPGKPTVDSVAGSSDSIPGSLGSLSPDVCQGIQALIELTGSLDQLVFRRLDCAKVEALLTATQAKLTAIVSQFGGLRPDEKGGFAAIADSELAIAEEHLASAEAIAASMNSLMTHLTPASLAASCALCGGQVVFSPPRPSGAVTIDSLRQPLDRLVRSLASAAAQAPDRAYGARLRDLAQRLARVPGDRLHNVTYPSVSSVGQQLLALQGGGRDDRSLPAVVLLTALPRDARLTPMNVTDLNLLFRAFRVFERTLRIGVRSS